jgi:hypothetical protein
MQVFGLSSGSLVDWLINSMIGRICCLMLTDINKLRRLLCLSDCDVTRFSYLHFLMLCTEWMLRVPPLNT